MMISINALFLSLLAAAAVPKPTPPVPSSQLVITYCEIGDHYQFEVVECPIELRNTSEKPITVSQAEAKFPWDSIEQRAISVPPKGTSYIKARVDLRNEEGSSKHAFRFKTDELGEPYRGSEVRGYVQSVLEQAKPKLDFGLVRLGDGKLPSASVELTSRERADFRILGIESAPDWVDARIAADGRSLKAQILETAPWGLTHLGKEFVKLRINTPNQPIAWVEIEANVLGDVVPDTNPYQLGVIRTAGKHEFLIRISSRSGKAFETGAIAVTGFKAEAEVVPCVSASEDCRLIRLELAEDAAYGKLDGIVEVELPRFKKKLAIELVGMLLDPQTKIHKMEDLVKQSASRDGGMSTVSATPDIRSAIKGTLREDHPPPPGNGPLLRWAVAHQAPIHGYAIYRASSENGPFLRVSKDVIEIIEDEADKTGRYQWRDNTTESGKTYWYRIGVLNRDGSKKDLTAAQKVVAK